MNEPLTPGARGAFLLQLAAAHYHASHEACAAMASTARLILLVEQHRALARTPSLGVPKGTVIAAGLTEPFDGAAAELVERLRRARGVERQTRDYHRFLTFIENAANVEHHRLLARGT